MGLDYYFNEWAFLAQTDPEAFERRRREYIEEFLSRAGPRRPYLEALQGTIDAERKLAGRPRDSMLVLCRMMCHSLIELQLAMKSLAGDLKALERLPADAPRQVTAERASARLPVANRRRSLRVVPRRLSPEGLDRRQL